MEKNHTKIDDWLNGNLPADERQAFEQAMEKDAALQKEVKTQILERETAALFFAMELKNDLATWKAEKGEPTAKVRQLKPTRKTNNLRRIWSIAAGFLLLFSLGMLWWFNQAPSDKVILAEQYIKADFSGDRGEEGLDKSTLDKAIIAFQNNNYAKSIAILEANEVADSIFVAAQYLIGHAHFQQKNYAKTIAAFQQVVLEEKLPPYVNRDKLKWNLLLAYIGNEQKEAAYEQLLNDLIENGVAPYNRRAKELKK